MPAKGTLASALLPHVESHVRWYTGRVSVDFAPTASTPLGDLWRAVEVEWDEGTPSRWPYSVSPWQVRTSSPYVLPPFFPHFLPPFLPSLPPFLTPTPLSTCARGPSVLSLVVATGGGKGTVMICVVIEC